MKNFPKKYLLALFLTFVVIGAVAALPIFAQETGVLTGNELAFNEIKENTGLINGDIRVIIVRIIRVLLGFLGIVAVGIIMYGGYTWMTAGGNAERVETAKKILRNGLIGLIIILASFAIVSFLLNRLLGGMAGVPSPGQPPSPCTNCFALGGGIIEDHYPGRGDTVPRNIWVFITFKEPIMVLQDGDKDEDAKSIIQNAVDSTTDPNCSLMWCGDANDSIFKLDWTLEDENGVLIQQPNVTLKAYTNDLKTFVFKPVDAITDAPALLGDAAKDTAHTARVIAPTFAGSAGLYKANGDKAMLGNYSWPFTVTTVIDTTPPQIVDINPSDGNISPRNDTIMVTFNEAINPISATGVYDPSSGDLFNNIVVHRNDSDAPRPFVTGIFEIGNGYRTIEFTTFDRCGTNSCNQDVFCLPENANLAAVAKSATLWTDVASGCAGNPPFGNPSQACTPINGSFFDGIVDAASNSLDGERRYDTVTSSVSFPSGDDPPNADGPLGDPTNDLNPFIDPTPLGDTFWWTLSTNDKIIISGPVIERVTPTQRPELGSAGALEDAPIEGRFTRRLRLPKAYTDPLSGQTYDPAAIYEQIDPVNNSWQKYEYGFTLRLETAKLCLNDTNQFCVRDTDCGDPKTDETARCLDQCNVDGAANLDIDLCATDQQCTAASDALCGKQDLVIKHSGLTPLDQGGAEKLYESRFGSTIRDRLQNCFYPSVGPLPNELYPLPVPPWPDVPVDDMTVF